MLKISCVGSILTRQHAGLSQVRIPAEAKENTFPRLKKNNIYIVIVYPRVKHPGREFDHQSRSSAEVNEWNCTSPPLYGFMACTEKALYNTVISITRYYSVMKMLYNKKLFFVECKIMNVKNVESYFRNSDTHDRIVASGCKYTQCHMPVIRMYVLYHLSSCYFDALEGQNRARHSSVVARIHLRM